jgi:hypothetical protein
MRATIFAAMIAAGAVFGFQHAASAQDQDRQIENTDRADAQRYPYYSSAPDSPYYYSSGPTNQVAH